MDVDGQWCFYKGGLEVLRSVTDKLRNFETMTWADIKKSGNSHSIPPSDLKTDAQRRLLELGLDTEDNLFSLRLSGKKRVWGIRRGDAILHLLWWDPCHQVCKSDKKHT